MILQQTLYPSIKERSRNNCPIVAFRSAKDDNKRSNTAKSSKFPSARRLGVFLEHRPVRSDLQAAHVKTTVDVDPLARRKWESV